MGDRKSQTSSGKSDQFVKTSERFVDSNNENMDPELLDVSLISVSESLAEEFIGNVGNSNLSGIIDPSIFDTSMLSESGKGKLTNGQLVKNKSMKDCLNVENAVEAVNVNVEIGVEAISLEADQSVEGGKSQGDITKDCVNGNIESAAESDKGKKRALAAPPKSVKGKKCALKALDGNIESAAEALAAPPKSVKGKKRALEALDGNIKNAAEADSESVITVKGLKRALEVASKSVKKGKITLGQKVKNGRNNKDINDIVKRVTRKRTQKNYCKTKENDFIYDSEEEFIPETAERIVESEESDDDCRKQPKRGRPTGVTNKKSRKFKLVKNPSINDGENEEVNETEDIDKEGESGCKSPVKKKNN